MTVESTSSSVSYLYTGPGDYSYLFKAYLNSDIVVEHVSTTGAITTLAESTDYTLLRATEDEGGTVTTTYAPTTGTLRISRILPLTQSVALENQGPLGMETLEKALDRNVMILQQMQATVDGVTSVSNWKGDWVGPDTTYTAKDMVRGLNGNWYYCLISHVSSDTFAEDLASGVWLLALDVVYIDQRAQDASAAAIEAGEYKDAAATSETNAATSEANAATSESNAATSESNAATSEANAATSESNAATSAAEAASLVLLGNRSDAIYPDYYTATEGQEDFDITQPTAQENILVFMNSRKLRITEDYTLNSETAASVLTLTTPAEGGEELDIVSINTYDLTGMAEDMSDLLDQATTIVGSLDPVTEDVIVYVGPTGDYATINEAIAALNAYRRSYVGEGLRGFISLQSTFVMKEQVFAKYGVDLSWMVITGGSVTVERSYLTQQIEALSFYPWYPLFCAFHGGKLPAIHNATFTLDTSGGSTSRGGVYVIGPGSSCVVRSAQFWNCPAYAYFAYHGGVLHVEGPGCSGSGSGLVASQGGRISAYAGSLSGCTTRGAYATQGGHITLDSVSARKGASNSTSDIVVASGGVIQVTGGTGGVSQTANVLTSSGVIFQ